jgi:hypothetical protein
LPETRTETARFQDLTAITMKITAIWEKHSVDSLIKADVSQLRTSYETSVYINEITQRYIPEGCHIQQRNHW